MSLIVESLRIVGGTVAKAVGKAAMSVGTVAYEVAREDGVPIAKAVLKGAKAIGEAGVYAAKQVVKRD